MKMKIRAFLLNHLRRFLLTASIVFCVVGVNWHGVYSAAVEEVKIWWSIGLRARALHHRGLSWFVSTVNGHRRFLLQNKTSTVQDTIVLHRVPCTGAISVSLWAA